MHHDSIRYSIHKFSGVDIALYTVLVRKPFDRAFIRPLATRTLLRLAGQIAEFGQPAWFLIVFLEKPPVRQMIVTPPGAENAIFIPPIANIPV
jgi:hypothetical protein